MLPIFSINYEFMAQNLEGGKHLWIDTSHALSDLNLHQWRNQPVRIVSASQDLQVPTDTFVVDAVIGARLMLLPITPRYALAGPRGRPNDGYQTYQGWHPLDHSGDWGYSTRDFRMMVPAGPDAEAGNAQIFCGKVNRHNQNRNHNFGHGCPVAYLVPDCRQSPTKLLPMSRGY